ncbi:MAG: hypothetical protein WD469_03740 [Paenibacillaceae bacterium]
MVNSRMLLFATVVELGFGHSTTLHIVGVFLAKTVRERNFSQVTARIPLVLASTVRLQVADRIILVIVFLVAYLVVAMDQLIPRVIHILRSDNGISFSNFMNPFKKFRFIARGQVNFTVDDIVDSGDNMLDFSRFEQHFEKERT